jgi:hypothetical protein
MSASTMFLVTTLSICAVTGCSRREDTTSSDDQKPPVAVLPAAKPKPDRIEETPSAMAQKGAETMAAPVAPKTVSVPHGWVIESASREAHPEGGTTYAGKVRVEAPDGTVIQSDKAELVVSDAGEPTAVVYEGNVRMQRPDGSVVKAPKLEIGYNSAGHVMSIKAPQIEYVRPKK